MAASTSVKTNTGKMQMPMKRRYTTQIKTELCITTWRGNVLVTLFTNLDCPSTCSRQAVPWVLVTQNRIDSPCFRWDHGVTGGDGKGETLAIEGKTGGWRGIQAGNFRVRLQGQHQSN